MYISVNNACGKVGGSGGMLPLEVFDFGLLLDANWWNL